MSIELKMHTAVKILIIIYNLQDNSLVWAYCVYLYVDMSVDGIRKCIIVYTHLNKTAQENFAEN